MPRTKITPDEQVVRDYFHERLHDLLVKKNMSDPQLAAKINEKHPDSVNSTKINRWVSGHSFPNPFDLVNLAQALEVSIDDLLPMPPKLNAIEKKVVDGFEWESRLPDPQYFPEEEYRELARGVTLFNRIMEGDVDALRMYDDMMVTRAIIAALRSGHIQLLKVPRHAEYEAQLGQLFPNLKHKHVLVAAVPNSWRNTNNVPGRRIIKTEFVDFLAAREVLHGDLINRDRIGLGVGMSVLRLGELSTPTSQRFLATTWIGLAAGHSDESKSFTNHSANGIASLMFNRHPGSSVRYATFVPLEKRETLLDVNSDWASITTAFISVTDLQETHYTQQIKHNFAIFGEHPPLLLQEIYAYLKRKQLTKNLAGHILGHMIDAHGRPIPIEEPKLAEGICTIPLELLQQKVKENAGIYLIGASRHKINAIRAVIKGGYCNCMVIEATIAEGLLN